MIVGVSVIVRVGVIVRVSVGVRVEVLVGTVPVGVGVAVPSTHEGNLNEPMRVFQLKLPVV